MASAVPNFAYDVRFIGEMLFYLLAVVLAVWAFLHAAVKRADLFPAVGTLQKVYWLLILGGCALFLLLTLGSLGGFVRFIAVTAGAFYLLDVRLRMKDAAEGRW